MIDQKCIKCGNNGADIEYVGNITNVFHVTTISRAIEVHAETYLSCKEVLKITCQKCSYVWMKNPLDVQERNDYIEKMIREEADAKSSK